MSLPSALIGGSTRSMPSARCLASGPTAKALPTLACIRASGSTPRWLRMGDLRIGEHAAIGVDAPAGHVGVFWIQLDQDGIAAKAVGDHSRGSSSSKRVKHSPAGRRASLNARLDQGRRKCRKVRLGERLRSDRPNVALIALPVIGSEIFVPAMKPGLLARLNV